MKRFALLSVASVFSLLAFSSGAFSADTMFMTATGQKQGLIKGGVTQKGLEGWMRVLEFEHGIISPRDPASGLPTGKRQHKPLRVKLLLDKATPLLMNSLVNNENLPQLEIRFCREIPNAAGTPVLRNVFFIRLTNANVASATLVDPDATKPAAGGLFDATFTYQRIEWTWADGGITAMDDWEAPVVF
jgi:type VI secretion system secreted protein Hcp